MAILVRLPPARATVAFCLLIALAWLVVASAGLTQEVALRLGFLPVRFSEGVAIPGAAPAWSTPLTAMLVHEGLPHLGFNLLVLGYCGRFFEPAVGRGGIVLLCLIGAYAAGAVQFRAGPHAPQLMVGASGAISAIVGAYSLLFGERKVCVANRQLAHALHVAWLMAAWIGIQLLIGFSGGFGGQATRGTRCSAGPQGIAMPSP